jgi:hypothetical protein
MCSLIVSREYIKRTNNNSSKQESVIPIFKSLIQFKKSIFMWLFEYVNRNAGVYLLAQALKKHCRRNTIFQKKKETRY